MQSAIELKVLEITAQSLVLGYTTLPGNRPKTYGNQVYLWQTGQFVPWSMPPLASAMMDSDAPTGQVAMNGLELQVQSYLAAYSVGPEQDVGFTSFPNVACSVLIPALDASEEPCISAAIKVVNFTANTVTCAYTFLPGFMPAKAGSFIAIWQGPQASYTQAPLATMEINSDASEGAVSFNGMQITIGSTYSVGLFTTTGKGSQQTALAATDGFST